jgi:broad specificity phosphatase PhoE
MTRPFAHHRIIFVRHGQTSFNAENRLQGQRDVPLDGKGRAQASAVGRHLREAMSGGVAAIESRGAFFASPLIRARETMELIRVAMGLSPQPYQIDARLKELTFGAWEGLTWPEVWAKDPAGAKAREADKWNFAPPGGESYAMLAARVRPWLEELTGETFLVAHGGVARALCALIAGMRENEAASVPIWQGRALVFERGAAKWVG